MVEQKIAGSSALEDIIKKPKNYTDYTREQTYFTSNEISQDYSNKNIIFENMGFVDSYQKPAIDSNINKKFIDNFISLNPLEFAKPEITSYMVNIMSSSNLSKLLSGDNLTLERIKKDYDFNHAAIFLVSNHRNSNMSESELSISPNYDFDHSSFRNDLAIWSENTKDVDNNIVDLVDKPILYTNMENDSLGLLKASYRPGNWMGAYKICSIYNKTNDGKFDESDFHGSRVIEHNLSFENKKYVSEGSSFTNVFKPSLDHVYLLVTDNGDHFSISAKDHSIDANPKLGVAVKSLVDSYKSITKQYSKLVSTN